MDIEYKNKRIQKVCTDASAAKRKYGPEMAEKIHHRIDEIAAADNVDQMLQYHIGRCHRLRYDRENQYALDLIHPMRLIFEKKGLCCSNSLHY